MWAFIVGCLVGYILGWYDARWGMPPEPLKGNYKYTEDPNEDEKGNYDFD